MLAKTVECVPNFSVGRDLLLVEKLADCYRGCTGVKLLDYSADADHNRCVITAAGEPQALCKAVFNSIKIAVDNIDLNKHHGGHPRIGAADVIPFVPLFNMEMQEVVELSRQLGKLVGEELRFPVFLYEQSATSENRMNLAEVRKGGFEGLASKLRQSDWQPDFGPPVPHTSAGACAIGARKILCAFNVNLRTDDVNIARQIAGKVREKNGGLPSCKALGLMLESGQTVQVSMNLTDYTQTGLHQAFEQVCVEAEKLGVEVASSELIGLAPLAALNDSLRYYMKLDNLTPGKILDFKLYE